MTRSQVPGQLAALAAARHTSAALATALEARAMLVPMVIETSSRGERAYDIYSRLLRGADHLPGRRDRGPRRQPDHRPAAVPRGRGPGARHQPVHQLARRRGHVRPRHLRHDAVPAGAGEHHLHRHGRVDGLGAAGRGRQGQALRAAQLPDHDPPGVGRVPGQHARRVHPGQGARGAQQAPQQDPRRPHRPDRGEGRQGHRPGLLHVPRTGQGIWHHRRGVRRA